MPRQARSYLDKTEVDRSVVDLARERIDVALDRYDHVAVAFSGGKDSTICLNLVLEQRAARGITDPLDVLFYDEEAIPYDTEDYVRRVAERDDVQMRWFCLPIQHVNGCSPAHPWWYPWAPEARELWCRPMPPEATPWPEFPTVLDKRPQVADYAPAFFPRRHFGTVGYIMGIRADESMTRLRAVTRKKRDNFIVPYNSDYSAGNVDKVYPIYDWRTPDVWTAPNKFGWDYNTGYDLQELHGFHGSRQRIAPPFGQEPMQMLGMYATCWPELWDRMVDRVPGAAAAARYARTELYSFRGRPTPHEGETWQDLIVRLLNRHAPSVRTKVKERIEDEIRWHYGKTTNPILPTAPHPVTGMTWEWLSMVALRGDYKKRKNAGWELGDISNPDNRAKIEAEYRAQHKELYE